jgi:rhomboid-related protein 1/2/3
VLVYVYHVVHFRTHPDHVDRVQVTWTGPEPVCSVLVYNPARRHEAWRFVSYCLAHAGVQHVLTNMLMQLFVGLFLEASHGHLRVAAVYLAGVVGGSLGSSVIDPNVFLAGASGGVYALITAHLATLILNWREDIVIMRNRFRRGKAPAAVHGHIVRTLRLVTVLAYGVADTGVALYRRRQVAAGVAAPLQASWVAHVCGMRGLNTLLFKLFNLIDVVMLTFLGAFAGLLVGVVALKNRKVERWESGLKGACLALFAVGVALAVVWNAAGDAIVAWATGDAKAKYFPTEDLGKLIPCHEYI